MCHLLGHFYFRKVQEDDTHNVVPKTKKEALLLPLHADVQKIILKPQKLNNEGKMFCTPSLAVKNVSYPGQARVKMFHIQVQMHSGRYVG